MKRYMFIAVLAMMLCACVKPDEREKDASCELRSLKAYVYYDVEDFSKYREVDLLSGMYIEDQGIATFTFPDEAEVFNQNTLGRCRVEATVPSTAKVVMADESGNSKNYGIGGWHDLYNASIYFNIIADNGVIKNFQIICRCRN